MRTLWRSCLHWRLWARIQARTRLLTCQVAQLQQQVDPKATEALAAMMEVAKALKLLWAA
jgi:outer membrane murein-binding lipoprotein Lpp